MFVVSEEAAAAIRTAYEQDGELSAAIELRRHSPASTTPKRGTVRGLSRDGRLCPSLRSRRDGCGLGRFSSSVSFRLWSYPSGLPTTALPEPLACGAVSAARTDSITVVCRLCPRIGRRRTDRLLAEHGPHMRMPDLLRLLAAGCPRLDSTNITDRCDVHCPDLGKLFLPAVAPGGWPPAIVATGSELNRVARTPSM
jgi:hypothetical protein